MLCTRLEFRNTYVVLRFTLQCKNSYTTQSVWSIVDIYVHSIRLNVAIRMPRGSQMWHFILGREYHPKTNNTLFVHVNVKKSTVTWVWIWFILNMLHTYVQLCTYNKQQIFSASLRPPLGVNFDPLEWNGPLGVKFLVKSTPIDENPLFALLYLGVTRFAPKGHSSSPEANSCWKHPTGFWTPRSWS
jgi:hypothetical protein